MHLEQASPKFSARGPHEIIGKVLMARKKKLNMQFYTNMF